MRRLFYKWFRTYFLKTATCQAIEAIFVFGPQYCHKPSTNVVLYEGEYLGVCAEHDVRGQ